MFIIKTGNLILNYENVESIWITKDKKYGYIFAGTPKQYGDGGYDDGFEYGNVYELYKNDDVVKTRAVFEDLMFCICMHQFENINIAGYDLNKVDGEGLKAARIPRTEK